MKNVSRVRVEIDRSILRRNFSTIQKTVAPAEVMAVLKADAYGMGVSAIAETISRAGCMGFGVAELSEALVLKKKFIKPVYILSSLLPDEIAGAVRHNIVCPVDSRKQAELINKEARRQKKTALVHLIVDTGMGRLGVLYAQAADFLDNMGNYSHLRFEGMGSHFPNANNPAHPVSKIQIERFKKLASHPAAANFKYLHLANSDGINNFKESYFNLVRTGINLYGVFDLQGRHVYELKPAVSLKTRLIAKRLLPKGSTVGYGLTHTLKKDTWVGTLPAGYADGVPLALSNRGEVLIRGIRRKVIGRVSMDYTNIDLADAPAEINDECVLFGTQKNQSITVENWAQMKQTHPYEILCSLGRRVERVYLGQV